MIQRQAFSPTAEWFVNGAKRRLMVDDAGFYTQQESGGVWTLCEPGIDDLVAILGLSSHEFPLKVEDLTKVAEKEFEELWLAYGNWNKKAVAKRIYLRLRKKRKIPEIGYLLLVVRNMRAGKRLWLEGFQPHLSTWLNAEGWTDGQDPKKGRLLHGEFYPY